MPTPHRHKATLVRFSAEERALLENLRSSTGLTLVGVLRLALRDLARRQLGTARTKKARR